MRSGLGHCCRGAKTNTVLHSQGPALHPFARVQAPWTNRGQVTDSRRRSKQKGSGLRQAVGQAFYLNE